MEVEARGELLGCLESAEPWGLAEAGADLHLMCFTNAVWLRRKTTPNSVLSCSHSPKVNNQGVVIQNKFHVQISKFMKPAVKKTMEWSPNLQHKNRNQWWHKGVINKNTGGS